MSDNYGNFLAGKAVIHHSKGIESPEIHEALFPFQQAIVRWALRKGSACIFAGTGLGKTAMQCDYAGNVEAHTDRPVLILAPLAVAHQTIAQAKALLGMDVKFAERQADVGERGVYITNYHKLTHFDASAFGGVVLDESSILKHEEGRYRTLLIESFSQTPFKLACTATPAPNDFMEIGNHAEFVGALTMSEMLSTFFVHDGGETQKWRLKRHAEADFWRWMASWCVSLQMPSDLGFSDDGYILPKLHVHEHVVASSVVREGELFPVTASTLKERRNARRDSLDDRVGLAAELISREPGEQWGVWCNLNDESAALAKSIPDAIEVKGSDSDDHKAQSMIGFAEGVIPALVSKPSICGFGMNFQSCARTVFVGLSDSFEQYYQAVRRFWRFGQKREVHAHVIISESEGAVLANIKRKQADAEKMQRSLVAHMADLTKKELGMTSRIKTAYNPQIVMRIPEWIS